MCRAPVRNKTATYEVVSTILMALACATVLVRLGYKKFFTAIDLGLDDWFILLALLTCVPSAVLNVTTLTKSGLGKRTSAYQYRVTGRGGQGITNILLGSRSGNGAAVVASFPIRGGDDVLLVTDAGRLIRVPVDQVRITGRASQGVMLFRVGEAEHVTSVSTVVEPVDGETVAEAPPANDDA